MINKLLLIGGGVTIIGGGAGAGVGIYYAVNSANGKGAQQKNQVDGAGEVPSSLGAGGSGGITPRSETVVSGK